jgi:hypothetical protein
MSVVAVGGLAVRVGRCRLGKYSYGHNSNRYNTRNDKSGESGSWR